MSTRETTYKRNSAVKAEAVKNLLSLFSQQWSETSKKAPEVVASESLKIVSKAYDIVPLDKAVKESERICALVDWIEKHQKDIKSSKLSVRLVGNDMGSTHSNILKIFSTIDDKNLRMFAESEVSKLFREAAEIGESYKKRMIVEILMAFVVGVLLALLIIFCVGGGDFSAQDVILLIVAGISVGALWGQFRLGIL